MPLTPDEAIALADDVVELYRELAGALRRDPDGKVRFTRKERERAGRMALKLATKLLGDAID